jgi:hypothetical protein
MHNTLLVNAGCAVRRRASRLECETAYNLFDLLLTGLVALGLVTSARVALSTPDVGQQLFAVAVLAGCTVSAFVIWRRRLGAVGTVHVDKDAQQIVQTRRGRERRWSFADVVAVHVRADGFDASRPDLLPSSPSCLELELADGALLRLAKGSEDELHPVLQTLEAWEIRPATPLS